MKLFRINTINMNSSVSIIILLSAAIKMLSFLLLFLSISSASAMSMNNMLMAQTLESFLSSLVSFGSMSITQKDDIFSLALQFHPDYNSSVDDLRLPQQNVFSTDDSKEALRSYLYMEIDSEFMEYETAETIASMLSLGALYPRDSGISSIVDSGIASLNGPAESCYTGEGNVVRLGRSNMFGDGNSATGTLYNGIWGYAVGSREYALQCHGNGLNILDVTDPANIFRVQFVPMHGGGIWRDVATHIDALKNKAYAYVGAQGNQGDGKDPSLFVIDLSTLSGNVTHSVDENPASVLDLGETPGLVHTINVDRGLLFLNTANADEGCRVYDLVANPLSPRFLFKTGGDMGRDCHDSSVIKNTNGKDLLVVSDGSGRRERIWDITYVNESWPTDALPPLIGETKEISGTYAHSNWASKDGRYIFCFDEGNQVDIAVHDISDPTQPKLLGNFHYSEESKYDAVPHNGEVRGNYLYVAFYSVGMRVFDISNPIHPYEVGKAETFRDADGTGVLIDPPSIGSGAWNTYPFLPSGNVLVSDQNHGLYVVKPNQPYGRPSAFGITAKFDGSGNTVLTWTASANARGYSVQRSISGSNFVPIVEHLTETTCVDSTTPFQNNIYRVVAVNGSGNRYTDKISSSGSIISTKASKRKRLHSLD